MDNHIKLYEKNSTNLMVYVSGLSDLTVYTPYITVKKKATDTSTYISKAGIVSDPSTTYVFAITSTDTSMNVGDYCYDITLESSTARHTIIKDRFSIIDTVRI